MPSAFASLPGQNTFAALRYQFECQPAKTLHTDWAARLIPFPDDRFQEPAAQPHLSRFLIRRLSLRAPFSSDHEEPAYGLAILPPAILNRLVRLSGAVLFASQLRQVIDGRVLRELAEEIGDGFLELIRTLAPFLYRDGTLGNPQRRDDESWLQAIERVGIQRLAAATRPLGVAVNGRLSLKFSPDHRDFFERDAVDGERDSFLLFKKILVREVDPSWAALF